MRFAAPAALIGLALLPVLTAWYAWEGRRRRAAAAAFARPALAASFAPSRPGWRRHAPLLILLLALAALIVALARPQRTVAVPVERAQIMLATDVSGSMEATDVTPDRLTAAQQAAQRFLEGVPARVNVGLLAFNQTPRVMQSPTTDRAALREAIARLEVSGGTATGQAIRAAVNVLRRAPAVDGRRPPSAIVLLSDGASTRGIDPVEAAQEARRLRIPIYTVALGTDQGTITVPRSDGSMEVRPVPPDPETLRRVARASGGRAYTAATAGDLSEVYRRLGSQLGRREERRELTAGFAGAAAVLLLAGGALSLRWFGRLI
mgnify:FL=1|jgi:Ca-activated chloride channel family protein